MSDSGFASSGPLDHARVRKELTTRYVAPATAKFVYLPSVDSTNRYAGSLARQGAPHGSLVIADDQTAGRGRLGRTWHVPPYTALTFSVILHDPADSRSPGLVMAAALAVYDLAHDDLGLAPRLKWPNDVLLGGRKVCGILIESVPQPPPHAPVQRDAAIVGIGLNVNATPREFEDRATCLAAAHGSVLERENVLVALLRHLDATYTRLLTHPAAVWQRWRSTLETVGSPVAVYRPDGSILRGMAEDVALSGALLVRDQDGHLHHVLAGDVTLSAPSPTPTRGP